MSKRIRRERLRDKNDIKTSRWHQLPWHILLKVFQCLDIEDRLKLECVCEEWGRNLDCPLFWRKLKISFPLTGSNKVLSCTKRILEDRGEHVRKLTIDLPKYGARQMFDIYNSLQEVLIYLQNYRKVPNVSEFIIENMNVFSFWTLYRYFQEVLMSELLKLIMKQRNLKIVRFIDCYFLKKEEGMILNALHRSKSTDNLTSLEINNSTFMSEPNQIFSHSKIVLKSFRHISELALSLRYVNSYFIQKLVDTNTYFQSLSTIKVIYNIVKTERCLICDYCWKKLRKFRPNINVIFIFNDCQAFVFEEVIFTESVYLYGCEILSSTQSCPYRETLPTAIEKLIRYRDSLKHFKLTFNGMCDVQLKNTILQLVEYCQKLSQITLFLNMDNDTNNEIRRILEERVEKWTSEIVCNIQDKEETTREVSRKRSIRAAGQV